MAAVNPGCCCSCSCEASRDSGLDPASVLSPSKSLEVQFKLELLPSFPAGNPACGTISLADAAIIDSCDDWRAIVTESFGRDVLGNCGEDDEASAVCVGRPGGPEA